MDCCFAANKNTKSFIRNIIKCSIREENYNGSDEYYCISNYELPSIGVCEIYVNKKTGIIQRIIINNSYIVKVGRNAVIDIEFLSGYSIDENIVKDKEPNIDEYTILDE